MARDQGTYEAITTTLLALAAAYLPMDLMERFKLSLRTPQYGPHHCEGETTESHLYLMLENLERIEKSECPDGDIPTWVMENIVWTIENMKYELIQSILLHDIARCDCMTLVFGDGSESTITMNRWLWALDTDSVSSFCEKNRIAKIRYFQKVSGKTRMHGAVAADLLREFGDYERGGFNEVISDIIMSHEIAVNFKAGRINIPAFENVCGDWLIGSIRLFITCAYLDAVSSLDANGQPNLGSFNAFCASRNAHRDYVGVTVQLEETDRLDPHLLKRPLMALKKAPDAFAREDVKGAVKRIATIARLPRITLEQVRRAMQPAIDAGVDRKLLQTVVDEMTQTGKLSKPTGKALGEALGPLNQEIRPALAQLGR